jgi:uncharacterized protein (TIGR02246 family)
MKPMVIFLVGLFLVLPPSSQGEDAEAAVRIPIQAFNKAFNEGFVGPADYATEDWNHINPLGGRDRGREATLKTVRAVHQTFLKGATETIEDIDVRFASEDVAVATVTSTSNPFTPPDGVKRGVARNIRTFVVVKRGGRWLIMQDQNTTIIESPH